jgi:hypothetical protein
MVRSAVRVTAAGLMARVTRDATGSSREEFSTSPAALVTLQASTTLGPVPDWKETAGVSVPAVISPPVMVQWYCDPETGSMLAVWPSRGVPRGGAMISPAGGATTVTLAAAVRPGASLNCARTVNTPGLAGAR